jgi:hypothetical protein
VEIPQNLFHGYLGWRPCIEYRIDLHWVGDVISGPFVWIGCALILREVWINNPTWREILKKPTFWGAVALIAIANVIWLVRHLKDFQT